MRQRGKEKQTPRRVPAGRLASVLALSRANGMLTRAHGLSVQTLRKDLPMIRRSPFGLALVASVFAVSAVSAQPATPTIADSGIKATTAIMRVSLYRYADGMQQAVLDDMRTHLIPIWEAQRAAGVLVNYSTMTNATASSKDDWQLGIVLTYKNWGAIDSLGARNPPITLKHYGSAAARTAANDARAKMRILVSTNLITASSYSRQ